jgi:hypothetical protein
MIGICGARTSGPRGGGGMRLPLREFVSTRMERPRDIFEPGLPRPVEARGAKLSLRRTHSTDLAVGGGFRTAKRVPPKLSQGGENPSTYRTPDRHKAEVHTDRLMAGRRPPNSWFCHKTNIRDFEAHKPRTSRHLEFSGPPIRTTPINVAKWEQVQGIRDFNLRLITVNLWDFFRRAQCFLSRAQFTARSETTGLSPTGFSCQDVPRTLGNIAISGANSSRSNLLRSVFT